jgi:predicted membrane protein
MTNMKALKNSIVAVSIALAVSVSPAHAVDGVVGNIAILFADPSDFVIELDKKSSCGSAYFNVQRANTNFKEVVALAMTALTNKTAIGINSSSCAGDRAIVSGISLAPPL